MPEGTELLFCFVIPVLVIVGSLFGWDYIRKFNDEMPLSWTIVPQSFRAIGCVFILYWSILFICCMVFFALDLLFLLD